MFGMLPHPAEHCAFAQFHAEAPEDFRLPEQSAT
jgi:hypothetical protein